MFAKSAIFDDDYDDYDDYDDSKDALKLNKR